MEVLEATVADIRRNTVAPSSRRIYKTSASKLILWIISNLPHLYNEGFSRIDVSQKEISKLIDSLDLNTPPLKFSELKAEHFLCWIVSLEKENRKLSYSTFNTHRAGLFNLFRDYHEVMDVNLDCF
jgi:hypothetical protein